MAYTVSNIVKTVIGNKYFNIYSITADANSGAVDTGFKVVEAAWLQCSSATTSNMLMKLNTNSGSTALGGTIRMSGFTNGDGMQLFVIGR